MRAKILSVVNTQRACPNQGTHNRTLLIGKEFNFKPHVQSDFYMIQDTNMPSFTYHKDDLEFITKPLDAAIEKIGTCTYTNKCWTAKQCCSNPNIITNGTMFGSFKVCRNCKKEII